MDYTSIKFARKELEISSNETTVDWNNYMREICAMSILNNPVKIGGEGVVVEIDESLFSKRKSNKGRVFKEQWVFGGVERESDKCFLYTVENRSAETLLKAIQDSVLPGSIIMSICLQQHSCIAGRISAFYCELQQ